MNYLRLAGMIGAALLLAFIAWRVSLSFSQAATIDAQGDEIDTLTAARLRDTRVARELAEFRGQQSDWSRQFHDDLSKQPLTVKVPPHVDPKTGAIEPCVHRDAARYRVLYNEAVTGTARLP